MTLLDWRKSSDRRSVAMDMLSQPTMVEMLYVMDMEHPGRQKHPVTDGFGATKALGYIEGYQDALTMLKSFAEPLPAAMETIQTTWGVDLPDPNQQ